MSGNQITHLSGLDRLPRLETLYADRQKTEELTLSVECMEALGSSLKTLSLNDCNVSLIEPLSLLFELEALYLSKNQIAILNVCDCNGQCMKFMDHRTWNTF